ncbi:MAG TPA: tetratricopeptide repeat protein [Kofleriaceae bacterium]
MKKALVILACIATPALAAPKKKKKKPPKETPVEPTPAPEPAPAPTPAPSISPPSSEPKPWAQGVPQDVQDKASALYEEGNTLFARQAHAPALEKYRAAIALWDHPLIRFNLAVTEIRLERILEAADNLEKALVYGDKPFKPELYQQALDYQVLLKGRVGFIEATCDQTATRLLLDGKPWFDCPGTKKLRVLAGEHAIVGEKQGFLTASTKVVVDGGETVQQKVKLIPLDRAVVLKYRYRRWIPWTMVGIGVAVGVGGAGTWFLGKNEMDDFEVAYSAQCQNGCEPGLTAPEHSALAAQRDSAELKRNVGIAMMGVGGAAIVTGVVLVIMNRGERVLPNVEVAPTAGGGVAKVGLRF